MTGATLGRDAAGRWTLTLTRTLSRPPADVWQAITAPASLSAWAPYAPDRPLDAVGPVTLTPVNWDGDADRGEVVEVEAPHRLVLDWGGGSLLHWTLVAAGDGTELTLIHVFDDRPTATSYAAGWHVCLDALVAAVAGEPTGNPSGRAAGQHGWQEIHDRYVAAFDASPQTVAHSTSPAPSVSPMRSPSTGIRRADREKGMPHLLDAHW